MQTEAKISREDCDFQGWQWKNKKRSPKAKNVSLETQVKIIHTLVFLITAIAAKVGE